MSIMNPTHCGQAFAPCFLLAGCGKDAEQAASASREEIGKRFPAELEAAQDRAGEISRMKPPVCARTTEDLPPPAATKSASCGTRQETTHAAGTNREERSSSACQAPSPGWHRPSSAGAGRTGQAALAAQAQASRWVRTLSGRWTPEQQPFARRYGLNVRDAGNSKPTPASTLCARFDGAKNQQWALKNRKPQETIPRLRRISQPYLKDGVYPSVREGAHTRSTRSRPSRPARSPGQRGCRRKPGFEKSEGQRSSSSSSCPRNPPTRSEGRGRERRRGRKTSSGFSNRLPVGFPQKNIFILGLCPRLA